MKVVHIAAADMTLRYLLLEQLKALRAEGYDVAGISAEGEHREVVEGAGIAFHGVPITRAFDPVADLKALIALYRVLRREKFDIVHTHTPKGGLLGQYAALLAGVPLRVHTIHGLYFPGGMKPERRWIYVLLERITLAFSHYNFSQNPEDVPVAIEEKISRPDRIEQIGNGISMKRFDPTRITAERRRVIRAGFGASDDNIVVGMVARLVEEKGYLEVFDAIRAIKARVPKARFVFIGGFEEDKPDAIKPDVLAKYDIDDVATLLGHRSDVDELYGAMDVFMLPSHREGFPRSVMEAAAMGLPSIVTNIRGNRQAVDHEVTGLIIPVRDPAALGEAIVRMVSSPEDRARFGAAAKVKAAKEFDERTVVGLILSAYRRLLSRRGITARR